MQKHLPHSAVDRRLDCVGNHDAESGSMLRTWPYNSILTAKTMGSSGTYLLSWPLSAFPREMLEAATVGRCGKLSLLTRINAPISLPSLAVMFHLDLEFFLPFIMLVSNSTQNRLPF